MSCEDKKKVFCNGYIHVLGIGTHVTPVFQSVRNSIEEKIRSRLYEEASWWLWSFSQVPSGLVLNEHINQRAFKSADILFLLVDTGDETAVQNVERIVEDAPPFLITILLGNGGQDTKERIASAVNCLVDLRNVRMEQYKKQETVEQIAYILISGIMEPFEGRQLVSMDFADIHQMFFDSGEIHFGVGHASFEKCRDEACRQAATEATQRLRAQCELRPIQRAFLSIECGEPVSIYDLALATEETAVLMDDDCDFIYNASVVPDMKDHVRAVLFATKAPVTRKASPVTMWSER